MQQLAVHHHEPNPLAATGPFFLTHALANYPGPGRVTVVPAELLYPADSDDCSEGRLFDLTLAWPDASCICHSPLGGHLVPCPRR